MGIRTKAVEMPDSPSGRFELSQHHLTRKFLVETDDWGDGPLVATGTGSGVPLMFTIYSLPAERHLYARLREMSAERREPNSLWWVITCEYSTPPVPSPKEGGKRDNPGEQDNPLLFIPEINMRTETYSQTVFGIYDSDNNLVPCMASNGEVYDPAPQKDLTRIHLDITRNEDISSAVPAAAIQYTNYVNSDTFWGAGPGYAKCVGITAERQNKQLSNGNQFYYLKVKYSFVFKAEGWDTLLLDNGSYYYDSMLRTKKLKFISSDGHPLNHGPLNGTGGKLPTGGTPVFNRFKFYPNIAFGTLGLPQNFPQTG